MNKNISIGVLILGVVVLGVLAFKAPSVISIPTSFSLDTSALGAAIGNQKAPIVNVPAPIVNVAAPQVHVNVPQQTPPPQFLGSVTNTEVLQNNFAIGGVREWSERKAMNSQASTTCSFKLGTASTSQLVAFNVVVASSSPGGTIELGYNALSPNSTSTLIAQAVISGGASADIIATSTAGTDHLGGLTFPNTLAPGGFLNVKYDGSTVNGFCEYKVREL